MLRYTQSGWPLNVSPEMKLYWAQREALTVEQNVLMWGIRVIVLKNLQNQVVQELHGSHPGIARMKLIGRSYVWWPCLDHQLEKLAKKQRIHHQSPPTPMAVAKQAMITSPYRLCKTIF